ncbi:MAG: MFS transporter [Burkholderiales bacterium]|jgi:predicted MFS family arabinose efflux permease|nr:MFS transporter [Burkholderiales bacterium]
MDPRLVALAFGNFVIGSGALSVPGMIGPLADGLGVSVPQAGRLIAAFAGTLCLLTPPLAAFTSRFDRRALLVAMLLLYVAGHAAAAIAPNYATLVAIRVATAIGAGLFTSQAAGVAGLLVPPEKRGGAIAFVFLGWSIASVAGMPLSAWIAATHGWREAFWTVSALAVIATAWVWRALPGGLRVQPIDRAAWVRLARHPALLLTISVTAIHAWAQFTVFSYWTVVIRAAFGPDRAWLTGLLVLFGVTGIVGNLAAVRMIDRVGAVRIIVASLVAMTVANAVLAIGDSGPAVLVFGTVLWGLACFAVNSAMQVRLVGLAPALAPVSIALNSSAIYFGQAAGAETGGRMLDWQGIPALYWACLPIFATSIAVCVWAARRAERPEPAPHPG